MNEVSILQLSYGNYVSLDDYKQLQQENEQLKEIICEKDNQLKEIIEQKTDYTEVNILEIKLEQLKKQKNDVVDYIHKELDRFDCEGSMSISMRISYFEEDLLRMLGEIDVED